MRNHKKYTWIEPENFKPVKILDVEISQPLPIILSVDENGQQIHHRALILVRLHGNAFGLLDLDFTSPEISPVQLADQIWTTFGEQIEDHLLYDEIPLPASLSPKGLRAEPSIKCEMERQSLLEDAPLISIVISTRDRAKSLAITFESLMELDYPRFEIILVDNAPQTNETYEFFTQNQDRFSHENISLRYIREDTPGLAIAHNRGLEEVKGSIVALTDDDVKVDKNWLREILYGFNAASNVGCVTGLVIPLELQTPAQVLFEEFGGFSKGFKQKIYDLNGYQPADKLFPYSAGRFGTGANMAFRTEFLEKTGGFDPSLGIGTPAKGADDMAAFFQAIIRGYRLVYQPSAVIFHQHRRTYDDLCKQMFGYGTGLTAFLTKCVMDNPELFFDIVAKVPAGIRYAFDPHSAKNEHKSKEYPRELEYIERKGMIYGPIAYLLSRWRYRKAKRKSSVASRNKEPNLSPDNLVGSLVEDHHKIKS